MKKCLSKTACSLYWGSIPSGYSDRAHSCSLLCASRLASNMRARSSNGEENTVVVLECTWTKCQVMVISRPELPCIGMMMVAFDFPCDPYFHCFTVLVVAWEPCDTRAHQGHCCPHWRVPSGSHSWSKLPSWVTIVGGVGCIGVGSGKVLLLLIEVENADFHWKSCFGPCSITQSELSYLNIPGSRCRVNRNLLAVM